MKVVIFYRKPKYHPNNYPWMEIKNSEQEAVDFIEKLSDEYDYEVYREIPLGDLYEYVE